MTDTITFIGTGKLGLPVALHIAEINKPGNVTKRFKVKAYDPAINEYVRHFHDTGVFPYEDLQLAKALSVVEFYGDMSDSIIDSSIIFIAVPTPHDPMYDGSTPSSMLQPKDFDYTILRDVLVELSHFVKPDQTVVVISTVLPGTFEREFSNILPKDVTLLYNPYFIAMGTVVKDFLNPEFFIIGSRDGHHHETRTLIEFYWEVFRCIDTAFDRTRIANLPMLTMTWNEAECTKVFYNTFISFKLAYVNMIQDVSQRLGNINTDVVTKALSLGTQRLLSPAYMKAGMGDGGPCHPRDNIALKKLSKDLKLGYDLFGEIMKARDEQAYSMAEFISGHGQNVVILGESFKPNVTLTDGSYSKLVGYYLQYYCCNTVFYVNCIEGNLTDIHGNVMTNMPNDGGPFVYLLAHNDPYWHDYDFEKDSVVIDPWRSFETPDERDDLRIVHYGNTRTVGD